MTGLTSQEIDKLKTIFKKAGCVKKAVLFGSRAMQLHRHNSDVDIVLYGDAITMRDVMKINAEIEKTTMPYMFDFVLGDGVNAALAEHIRRHGKVIYQNGWETKRLGEVCNKIGSGATPRGGKDSYKTVGIPLIRSQNVLDFSFSTTGLAFIDDNQAQLLDNAAIQENDVLINITGDSVARVCMVPAEYVSARVNQHVAIIRANTKKTDPFYLLYLLQYFKPHLLSIGSSGGTRNALTKQMLENLEFDSPPLEEQIEIGRTLRALDDKIANNTKINHYLEQMARAVFVEFQKMNVGEMSTVADVVDFNTDTYSPKENWTFVNYLDTGNITDGVIETVQRIDVGSEKLPSRARRKVKTNDIVYSTVRPIQRHFGIISHPSDNMLVSTGFAVIHSNHSAVCNEYLYLLLTAEDTIAQLQQLAEQSVSTYPSVKPSDIGLREILVPTSEDGEELRNQLSPLFSYMAANREESARLAALRDTLLPRLMSGEIAPKEM